MNKEMIRYQWDPSKDTDDKFKEIVRDMKLVEHEMGLAYFYGTGVCLTLVQGAGTIMYTPGEVILYDPEEDKFYKED